MHFAKFVAMILMTTFAVSANAVTVEEIQNEIRKSAIKDGMSCGLDMKSADEKWSACLAIKQLVEHGALRAIFSTAEDVLPEAENHLFALTDANGNYVSQPYFTSLPLICRNLGREEEEIRTAIKYDYTALTGEKLNSTQRVVDLQNAHIDLSNAIDVRTSISAMRFGKPAHSKTPLSYFRFALLQIR